jgi:hypothetical protein
MEQTALRSGEVEVDRWRDKIELRLDNRQVFFLFFGSAVVACMLFVLGVMVGKRIESRGAAAAPDVQDPLAVLDRARQPAPSAAVADEELTFPSTLIAGSQKARPAAVKVAAVAAVKAAAVAPPPKPPVPRPAPQVVAASPKPPLPVMAAAPRPPVPLMPTAKPAGSPAAPKPIGAVTIPAPAAVDPAKVRGKFTLQLSTFATQEDAETFARKYPGAFVIASDVPGRGMAYRVRLGNYGSFKDAAAAKDSFEREHKSIALVAAR